LITWGGRILTPGIFSKLVKATFYQQFVAGEDLNQVLHVRDQYRDMGIRSILDYSVEDDLSPEAIHKSMGENLRNESDSHGESDARKYTGYAKFADRRTPVPSARSYFYESENKCDQNLQDFLQCMDASGKLYSP
jgi:proline dehydrogenase